MYFVNTKISKQNLSPIYLVFSLPFTITSVSFVTVNAVSLTVELSSKISTYICTAVGFVQGSITIPKQNRWSKFTNADNNPYN